MKELENQIKDLISPCVDRLEKIPSTNLSSGITFVAVKNNKTLDLLQKRVVEINSELTRHGICSSFYFGNIKVSIIYTDEESFDICRDTNSYGLNIVLGSIMKCSGLKLTDKGLFYEEKLGIENHQSTVGDICITKKSEELFGFLKLSYTRFKKGFEFDYELMDFLSECPYLDQAKFLNKENKRNKKIISDLKVYLESRDLSNYVKFTFDDIDKYFNESNFLIEVKKLKAKEQDKREFIEKFNGKVVIEAIPDIDLNSLGRYMKEFKFSFGSFDAYKSFIMESDFDTIIAYFKNSGINACNTRG